MAPYCRQARHSMQRWPVTSHLSPVTSSETANIRARICSACRMEPNGYIRKLGGGGCVPSVTRPGFVLRLLMAIWGWGRTQVRGLQCGYSARYRWRLRYCGMTPCCLVVFDSDNTWCSVCYPFPLVFNFPYSSTLKMETLRCFETSVNLNRAIWRYIPWDRNVLAKLQNMNASTTFCKVTLNNREH
jgi:hypothetical protein